ncbi:MAG: hypothetical protein ABI040_09140 [Rhodoferax sp.]
MESNELSTPEPEPERDVLKIFLFPQPMLQRATVADSPEVRSVKHRHNVSWLKRWLPTYIGRWVIIFLVVSVIAYAVDSLQWPPVLLYLVGVTQYASAFIAGWMTFLYVELAVVK